MFAAAIVNSLHVLWTNSKQAIRFCPDLRFLIFLLIQQRGTDVVALDDALNQLAQLDRQPSLIVELRFFGGLTVEEMAAVLGTSPATIGRDWSMAKAWLSRELRRGSDGKGAAVGKD
jgi:hypothetical protein